jgi:DNA polymerase-4
MIRLVGVKLSKLAEGGMQLNLFDNSAVMSPLYLAMDKVRIKYGLSAIQPASVLDTELRPQVIEYQKYKVIKKSNEQ